MKVFNNSEVIAKGWYLVCPTQDIKIGQAKSVTICHQRIVLFRGQDTQLRALDAYCPHLGTDLGIGHVNNNLIRCFFHAWAFDGNGQCQDIPCQTEIPAKAKLQAYATSEKYGFIWIYPEINPPEDVAEFDELKGKAIVAVADQPLERNCHHHICMMNGIDAQHLKIIHKLDVNMQLFLNQTESGTVIDFTLKGKLPNNNLRGKLAQKLLGETYEYSMRYANGCLGLLTIMKNVRLFPPLYMLYAYLPLPNGKTRIQPIYITEKRKGILGGIISHCLLFLTRLAYYFLRDEDGKIYDNIQFNPNAILEIDTPLIHYINYVNKLEISLWSTSSSSQ